VCRTDPARALTPSGGTYQGAVLFQWSANPKTDLARVCSAAEDGQWVVRLIEPHYPKVGQGRRPLGLEKMLRIYFLQQWFNLWDPEDTIYDSESMRRFVVRYHLLAQLDPPKTTGTAGEPRSSRPVTQKFCNKYGVLKTVASSQNGGHLASQERRSSTRPLAARGITRD
jgi:hypothetical protein